MNNNEIIVLDFGSQHNQLIARKIRELNVYSEMVSHKITAEEIMARGKVAGIILPGSSKSVANADAYQIDKNIYKLGIPILGICYGMQLTAHTHGGKVEKAQKSEYGKVEVTIKNERGLFAGLPQEQAVWMNHSDQVTVLPEGFEIDASSQSCRIAAASNPEKEIYLLQFHPENQHSEYGTQVLKNFVFKIAQAAANWTMANFIKAEIEKIKAQVGTGHVLCALSGGVDSSVVAALIHKAIGNQLTCMFVDHGLLRKGEAKSVVETFDGQFDMNFIKIDAKDRFLGKLVGVTDPEEKRKIIGNEFIYCFDEESTKLKDMKFLAQGTLYTDVIESGTEAAKTIKSHHNVGGLPEDMEFELIEPLAALFKDEVRMLGLELGLPEEIVYRQPFPGPGLGIRVLGEVTEEKLNIVRETDAILREEIKKAGLERDVWQYFTALPDVKTVGVMGDERTYSHVIAIRGVTSIDGMTADWARIPHEVLAHISTRMINEVKGVNRVVYDITSKPPGTIEWE